MGNDRLPCQGSYLKQCRYWENYYASKRKRPLKWISGFTKCISHNDTRASLKWGVMYLRQYHQGRHTSELYNVRKPATKFVLSGVNLTPPWNLWIFLICARKESHTMAKVNLVSMLRCVWTRCFLCVPIFLSPIVRTAIAKVTDELRESLTVARWLCHPQWHNQEKSDCMGNDRLPCQGSYLKIEKISASKRKRPLKWMSGFTKCISHNDTRASLEWGVTYLRQYHQGWQTAESYNVRNPATKFVLSGVNLTPPWNLWIFLICARKESHTMAKVFLISMLRCIWTRCFLCTPNLPQYVLHLHQMNRALSIKGSVNVCLEQQYRKSKKDDPDATAEDLFSRMLKQCLPPNL